LVDQEAPHFLTPFAQRFAELRVRNGIDPPPRPARKVSQRRRKTSTRFCDGIDSGTREPERLLTAAEIRRSLQLYSAPELRRMRYVPISMIAHTSNLSRMHIYRIMHGYPLTWRTHTVLTRTISFIEHRQMEWRRLGNEWEAHQKRPNAHVAPPPIPAAPYLQTAADRKVFPHRVGGITFNIVHGW
jgi:hypothetical protein